MNSWHWKVTDRSLNEQMGLLYEPGNWGDLLKSVVVMEVVKQLDTNSTRSPWRILDPFAGRPHYPLIPSAARRLEKITCLELMDVLSPGLEEGRFPGTGHLVQLAAQAKGHDAEVLVFDINDQFLESWKDIPFTRQLRITSGYEALILDEAFEMDLVILDPYDLFDHWKEAITKSLPLARKRPVLLYLYNKSPRGEGFQQYYKAFRKALEEGLENSAMIQGRVPADRHLPRAFHEVILMGPSSFVEGVRNGFGKVVDALEGIITN